MAMWYEAIEPEVQSALVLAGLGQLPPAIVRTLRAQYPDLTLAEARRYARAATGAITQGMAVENEILRSPRGICTGEPVPGIPSGQIYVDAEFTATDPRTGRQTRRFMRESLPLGSTYDDVRSLSESFIAWIDARYGWPVNPNNVQVRYTAIMCSERT